MEPSRSEELLERFEHAWQSGASPALADFVPPSAPAAERCKLLRELLKIDLEYRWRRGVAERFLASYIRACPELLHADGFFVEWIGEEYRARHRWGDRPGHADYEAHFPDLGPRLREKFVRIDGELALEFGNERRRAIPQPAPQVRSPGARDPVMSQTVTLSSFVEALQRFRVLDRAQASATVLAELQQRFPEPRLLARELMQRGWLAPYQVNQVFLGRAAELWLGPYLIRERLGEGGMGQVFKARHVDMQRLVALKLIRKELLVDADAVARFRREVQVLSQLTHPHVVQAYDAGLTGPTPFLAMEFVEGVGLGQLVRERGPLPVEQACDYVRQAALGLQHIHERGLVHRDIKPNNLMVESRESRAESRNSGAGPSTLDSGLIKILDLGLARLINPVHRTNGDAPTASGALAMGTIDYMAPEQALDFSKADIRSDIYSLGCTLYFLLAGQVPFPEGTTAQKLLMHQLQDPAPLERFRPDLPAALPPLVLRMMAKQPPDRPQTPGEIARLLDHFVGGSPRPGALVPVARLALAPRPAAVVVVDARPVPRPRYRFRDWLPHRPSHPRHWIVVGAAVVLGLLAWPVARALWTKPEAVFLSDLPETDVVVLWNARFTKDGALSNGSRVMVGGRPSPKALCTVPPDFATAKVRYRLNREFRQFKAVVTLDDSFPECPTAVTFAVLCDGKDRWHSTRVKTQSDRQEVTVDVVGVDVLELNVICPGSPRPKNRCETYPIWVDPRLLK